MSREEFCKVWLGYGLDGAVCPAGGLAWPGRAMGYCVYCGCVSGRGGVETVQIEGVDELLGEDSRMANILHPII